MSQPDNNIKGQGLCSKAGHRELAYVLKYAFTANNNELEYKALIEGLRMALALNVEQFIIRGDSKVVFRHIIGSFEAKENHIKKYAASLWLPGSKKLTARTIEKQINCQKW